MGYFVYCWGALCLENEGAEVWGKGDGRCDGRSSRLEAEIGVGDERSVDGGA